jgi:chromosome partitioning protein
MTIQGSAVRVLTFVSQKGGAGKSTLACATAVAARLDGQRVALVDLDEQGSTAAWAEARKKLRASTSSDKLPDDIPLRKVGVSRIGAWFEEAKRRDIGDVLIVVDTAGTASEDVADALRNADVVLIPVQPSPQDLRALGPTLKQVREHAPGKFAFVLSRASHLQSRENAEITAVLEKHAPVAVTITDRIEFKRAIGFGLGPHESAAASKAAAEVDDLWEFVKGKLNGEAQA